MKYFVVTHLFDKSSKQFINFELSARIQKSNDVFQVQVRHFSRCAALNQPAEVCILYIDIDSVLINYHDYWLSIRNPTMYIKIFIHTRL